MELSSLSIPRHPCMCPTCTSQRLQAKYEAALKEIVEVVDRYPGTPGMPSVLAIVKKAMTPE